jgi:uncharacterized protein YdaU (DUF1376 family)
MKNEFYKMYFSAWNDGTHALSLEEEAAYLRLCHHMYLRGGPVEGTDSLLASLWRCHLNKARPLLGRLIAKGKICLTDDGKLINERVRRELVARDEIRTHRAQAGHIGGTHKADARRNSLISNEVLVAKRSKRYDTMNTAPTQENTVSETVAIETQSGHLAHTRRHVPSNPLISNESNVAKRSRGEEKERKKERTPCRSPASASPPRPPASPSANQLDLFETATDQGPAIPAVPILAVDGFPEVVVFDLPRGPAVPPNPRPAPAPVAVPAETAAPSPPAAAKAQAPRQAGSRRQMPDNWEPTEATVAKVVQLIGRENLYPQLSQFKEYNRATGRKMADWDAAFRMWGHKAHHDFGKTPRIDRRGSAARHMAC